MIKTGFRDVEPGAEWPGSVRERGGGGLQHGPAQHAGGHHPQAGP